ncbi:AcrR family transcriptional regulator [Luteibacter sp. Sphag1AF]|uniref:TetR/AcrR family transcriptional regulator n=1 Tax=Luteibacter sp. Sphag1AF TaxID=2587031 RepID=UPI00160F978A|nr:TetR/AcrR family transcriptional regulator [Luteibacter sp. Sphag1AF]MBB3228220.1 AcrR family transcriptional regulator [Luteibacter sp. Sphag1AF]
MARMTREESRTLTRSKLLASARAVFAREGYGGASVDRIAEHAGFTKGAFYSNFESKEDVFLQLLENTGVEEAEDLGHALSGIADPDAIIKAVASWANHHRKDPDTPLILYEMIRRARADATFGKRHEVLFHQNWLAVGTLLMPIFEGRQAPTDPLSLGALVMELTYGNALHFHSHPTAGDLVSLALKALRSSAPQQA